MRSARPLWPGDDREGPTSPPICCRCSGFEVAGPSHKCVIDGFVDALSVAELSFEGGGVSKIEHCD